MSEIEEGNEMDKVVYLDGKTDRANTVEEIDADADPKAGAYKAGAEVNQGDLDVRFLLFDILLFISFFIFPIKKHPVIHTVHFWSFFLSCAHRNPGENITSSSWRLMPTRITRPRSSNCAVLHVPTCAHFIAVGWPFSMPFSCGLLSLLCSVKYRSP